MRSCATSGPVGNPNEMAAPRRLYVGGILAFFAALLLYLTSMAPGVLWQDSGLAQTRVLQRDIRGVDGLALSHPLYYVFAIGFQTLPYGESAWKTNLVSAVFGAATVAGVFALLALLTRRVIPSAVGALSLSVAHTFWQHCALAEVYTVSTALVALEMLCFVRYLQSARPLWLVLGFLANGLGLSNHMLAALHTPVLVALLIILVRQRRVKLRVGVAALAAWALGAGLYLGLILDEWLRGEPLGEVLRSALFGGWYARNVLNFHVTPRLLGNSLLYLGLNFPTPAALLAIVGVASLRRLEPRPIGVVLGAMLAIHLLWAGRYDVPDQYTFFIPAIMLIAILVGLGTARLRLARSGRGAAWLLVSAALPAIIYVPLPDVARAAGINIGVKRALPYRDTYRYFLWPWKTGELGPRRFAEEVRDSLPPGAVVIAYATSARPLHYLMLAGQWQRDVAVWPGPAGRRDPPHRWPSRSEVQDALAEGKLYTVSNQPQYVPDWILRECSFEQAGIVFRVVATPAPVSAP